MPAKIDIDASKFLQNQEQIRPNTGKKLKTASHNSRFTGLKKKSVLRLSLFEKFWNLKT